MSFNPLAICGALLGGPRELSKWGLNHKPMPALVPSGLPGSVGYSTYYVQFPISNLLTTFQSKIKILRIDFQRLGSRINKAYARQLSRGLQEILGHARFNQGYRELRSGDRLTQSFLCSRMPTRTNGFSSGHGGTDHTYFYRSLLGRPNLAVVTCVNKDLHSINTTSS